MGTVFNRRGQVRCGPGLGGDEREPVGDRDYWLRVQSGATLASRSVGDLGKRASTRHDVRLEVRYGTAQEFVQEYAENLSHGGMLIRGAIELQPLSEVEVEIELPGLGEFVITAEVAHILTPEVAASCGREAGAGLAIRRAPKGFSEALGRYLHRLGRRADSTVLTTDPGTGEQIAAAGYSVAPAPSPGELPAWIVRAERPVIAVVVAQAEMPEYRRVAAAAGAGEIVHPADAGLDTLLRRIDADL